MLGLLLIRIPIYQMLSLADFPAIAVRDCATMPQFLAEMDTKHSFDVPEDLRILVNRI